MALCYHSNSAVLQPNALASRSRERQFGMVPFSHSDTRDCSVFARFASSFCVQPRALRNSEIFFILRVITRSDV